MMPLRNTPRSNRLTRLHPALDRLEGRALMANAGGIDPTFGGGLGYTVGSINPAAPSLVPATNPVSIVVEPDSSIAVAFPTAVNGVDTYGLSHLKADGSLDTAFGVAGSVDLTPPSGITIFGGPTTLLVQADKKILVVGAGTTGGSVIAETIAARFNADGSVDAGFGTNGVAALNMASLGVPVDNLPYAALQSDGKIVLAGSAGASPIATVRLTTAGAIDTTYGTNGLATPAGTTLGEQVDGLVIQPGNQALILATKFDISAGQKVPSPALLRLNADGSTDGSLVQVGIAGSGLATPNGKGIIAVSSGLFAVLGTTVSTSTTPGYPALAFFNADGSRLGSAPLFDPSTTLNSFAFDNHGRVVVTGFSSSTSSLSVFRLLINSSPDTTFGQGGLSVVPIPAALGNDHPFSTNALAVDPTTDNIILAGTNPFFEHTGGSAPPSNYAVARVVSDPTNIPSKTVAGDYTGDGKADPAVYLPLQGAFAIGDSSGQTPGRIVPFGTPGPGATIPVQGDFYGTGQDDIAAYIVQSGTFAIQDPTGRTSGISVQFGSPGAGQTIPAPGDYYGIGRDGIAVFLTGPAAFAIQDPTGQTSGMMVPFGMPGMNNSIPVPGDYDGSGRTELAVYVPSTATFYYRSAKPGGGDVAIPFGAPGLGVSLPMPGDYDGSGKTEVAVYIPALGAFYYRPANGGPDVKIPFGTPGAGKTLPAPGDYTGSGHTELGVYLTDTATLAYRPAGGGNDVTLRFGSPGGGQSIPVTNTVLIPFPGTSFGGNAIGGSFGIPGPSDGLEALAFPSSGKKAKPGGRPTS